jgi:S-adenosylmethionine synthetase
MQRVFTSESVSEGHPDKVADRISDEILDAALRQSPHARVAAEVLVTRDFCVIAGEVSGAKLEWETIAREAVRAIGYRGEGFDPDTMKVDVRIQAQSEEIARGVDVGGAGDQGIMFGYACRETDALMPAPIYYAHRIVERLTQLRRGGDKRLGPDAKCQVTLAYEGDQPTHAHTIVVSQMHTPDTTMLELDALIRSVVAELSTVRKRDPTSDTKRDPPICSGLC